MNTPPHQLKGLSCSRTHTVTITIEGGRISHVKTEATAKKENPLFVSPGWIDHQLNGCNGISFVEETLSVADIKQLTQALWKQGITTFLPTLTTESKRIFRRNISVLSQAMDDANIGRSIPGIHIEGPYISSVEGFRGAHPRQWICEPDWEEVVRWWELSEGRIAQLTIAPEVPGALSLIEKCVDLGIVIGLGHTNATAGQIHDAVKAGATVSTHLGNGCANLIHRHHNPLWPQLANAGLFASVIADGFHLTAEEMQVFWQVKGTAKTILVSDMTRLAGMPPGTYEDFGREVRVREDGAIMMPSENVLAGASLPLSHGMKQMQRSCGGSLEEIVACVSRNPARLFAWEDRGELVEGKWADMVLFADQEEGFQVKKTILRGEVVYEAKSGVYEGG
ncbi:MAG: N-acetylglucosamine-6-phosphate deacetylase [Bacteroidota bacterium]